MEIGFLRGVSNSEVDTLEALGLFTAEDVWRRIGANNETGLASLASESRISAERLLMLLEGDVAQFAKSRAGRWPTRHWLDLAALAAAIGLAFLLYRAWSVL